MRNLKLRYPSPMKPPPDDPEFRHFTEAMRQMMKVSKAEIQKRMEEEKADRQKNCTRAGRSRLKN